VFEMRGIPPAPGGYPQISVTLQLDERGRVTVEARDVDTGRHEKWAQAGGHVVLTNDGQ
jgi:molecular chaperone DnaK